MTKEKILEEFLDSLGGSIKLSSYLEGATTYETFEENLYDFNAFEVEFIYHIDAMKYLMKNDPSLEFAMSAVNDVGLDTKYLNSCILASILSEQNLKEDYFKIFEPQIRDFFENIDVEVRNRRIEELLENE